MPPPALPWQLVRQLVQRLDVDPATMVPIAPGFSGATVWSASSSRGKFAIKRWPTGVTLDRVAEVHRVVCRTSVMPRLQAVGDGGQTQFIDGNQIFDVTQWVSGCPLPTDAAEDRIAAAASTIGCFHAEVNVPLGDGWHRGRSATVASRIDSAVRTLSEIRLGEFDLLSKHPQIDVRRCGDWIRSTLGNVVTDLLARGPDPAKIWTIGWVLRDVHREHVLVDGDSTRIIDPDAIRVDTPMADLARWIGSFDVSATQLPDLIDQSMADWTVGSALNVDAVDADVIDWLVRISTHLTLCQWTRWLWIDRKLMPVARETLANRWRFWLQRSIAVAPPGGRTLTIQTLGL